MSLTENIMALNFVMTQLFVALHQVFPDDEKLLARAGKLNGCCIQLLAFRNVSERTLMKRIVYFRMELMEKASAYSSEMSSNPNIWKWYSYMERIVENIMSDLFYNARQRFDVSEVYHA